MDDEEQPPSAEQLMARIHTPAAAAARGDGERDALALLALSTADSWDSARALAILNNADGGAVCGVLLDYILELLAEFGTDPAAWIQRKQAELIAEIAGDGDG
jgi:hypothetical protein